MPQELTLQIYHSTNYKFVLHFLRSLHAQNLDWHNLMAKILVVDNNMLFLRYAKTFLEKQFEVYTSSTIESAGIFMMNFDFDLIVIDEGMGSGKAGFDFTIRQKQKQRFCKTPVIMLYVTADENDYRFPADPKIDRYIAKKYSREYLLGNILEVLK